MLVFQSQKEAVDYYEALVSLVVDLQSASKTAAVFLSGRTIEEKMRAELKVDAWLVSHLYRQTDPLVS